MVNTQVRALPDPVDAAVDVEQAIAESEVRGNTRPALRIYSVAVTGYLELNSKICSRYFSHR